MNNVDRQYNDLLTKVIEEGDFRGDTRTGIGMTSISMESVKHDLREGFPLITSRRVPIKSAMVELEGFINGIIDKRWYQLRGCHFWDWWCNPCKVPYGTDEKTLEAMRNEPDLGEIYGSQWRNFRDPRDISNSNRFNGVDQLGILLDKLKDGVYDRRLIVSAWNPLAFHTMALVPCHTDFEVYTNDEYIDLQFNMRSNDLPLGYPSNQAFYAMLLMLLGKQANKTPRYLKHNIVDAHIYSDQMELVKVQLNRETHDELPTMSILSNNNHDWDVREWTHKDFKLENYKHSGVLKYPIPAI